MDRVLIENYPLSFWKNLLEAGEKEVKAVYRIEIGKLCRANNIKIGDYVTIYLKKKDNGKIIEAGSRKVQSAYRVSLKDVCERNNINIGDSVIVYVKKINK
jgi:hypothetical protein